MMPRGVALAGLGLILVGLGAVVGGASVRMAVAALLLLGGSLAFVAALVDLADF